MRYSLQPRSKPKAIAARTNRDFFRRVADQTDAAMGRAAVLLVGGSDLHALAVRRAQAVIRFDRRPSYFSHAALITHWNPKSPGQSLGLEASLDPDRRAAHVPEHNGVTPFRVRRYFDDDAYPNLALIVLELKPITIADETSKSKTFSSDERKNAIVNAAQNPCRERELYPLWESIGTWAKYRYTPEQTPNPLLENVSLPAAAFCEYVFGAQQIDLTPGALGRQTCPELLWATFLHWQEGLLAAAMKRIVVHSLIRDEQAIAPPALPMEIRLR